MFASMKAFRSPLKAAGFMWKESKSLAGMVVADVAMHRPVPSMLNGGVMGPDMVAGGMGGAACAGAAKNRDGESAVTPRHTRSNSYQSKQIHLNLPCSRM